MHTIPKKNISTMLAALALIVSAVFLSGCDEPKGEFEKAGEKMDETVNDAKRTLEDAAD